MACLYDAFPAEEARELARRFEPHYTPKHGSWLNMAETELRVPGKQCLDRRIAGLNRLSHETTAWPAQRNRDRVIIQWRFTVRDARRRLAHLYPVKP